MEPPSDDGKDLISELPDECLALIIQRVRHKDLKSCTLVCRKWLILQGQNQQSLSFRSESINITSIPFLFSRFDSVTKLVIDCSRRYNQTITLGDEELELISTRCSNLTTFKIIYSSHVTDVGMAALGTHATHLKKFSCRCCNFGAKALNALLSHSSSLEAISLDLGRDDIMFLYPGAAASSLKSICLHECHCWHAQWFVPLLTGSKNLTSFRIQNNCFDHWVDVLNRIANRDNSLFELYLNPVHFSDIGFSALSIFSKLEFLHVTAGYSFESLDDEALSLISTTCRNLTTFKLRRCHLVTHVGMAALGRHATRLKKFSCRNCKFGAKGLNALVSRSSSLQEISIKYLRGGSSELINPCDEGSSLKSICLKDLYNNDWPQCFAPLITSLKNPTSLRLLQCLGNWDDVLNMLANGKNSLSEVCLNMVQVTDAGLSALSSCSKLEILQIIGTPKCTNV